MRKLLSIMALFVISLLTVSMVSAATSSTFGSLSESNVVVKVNDKIVNGQLTVEEGETLEIEVELNNNAGTVDAEGIRVRAELGGYEYADHVDVEDSLDDPINVKAGSTKFVDLELTVPKDLDNGENTLRVFLTDRNSASSIEKVFKLNVESPRHLVDVKDVRFTPGNTQKAGLSLLTTVVLENFGSNPEEDIEVTVAVSKLGISASEQVDEIDAEDVEDVPEMFLPIPANAAEGDYTVEVTVEYDKHEKVTKTYTLHVLANEMFAGEELVLLAVSPETQAVAAGKTATYGIALANGGVTSKAYMLETVTGDWATASLSENLVVLEPGKNKVVYVDVAVANDAAAGNHAAGVVIKSGDEVLETVSLNANVVASTESNNFSLRNGLEIALIVLVVLLVIIGLIIGFSRLKKDDEEEEQTYY